jgi:exosortase/archaeosortase family protein
VRYLGSRHGGHDGKLWITGSLAVAAVALAVEPAAWLVRTWVDPSYASVGGWAALAVAALFAWSTTSAPNASDRWGGVAASAADARVARRILVATAAVRLAGRILAVNVLGAVALVLDVYALGRWLGLARRARSVSPLWLAFAFAFTLPLERILQRLSGYALQQVSAAGACGVLAATHDAVTCAGTRIVIAGRDVLVDLPCAGARGLVQLLLLYGLMVAVRRPRLVPAAFGLALTLGAALVSNTLRVAALAIGIAHPEAYLGVDVMAQPWHDVVGALALAFGAVPLVLYAGALTPAQRPTLTAMAEPEAATSSLAGRRAVFGSVAFAVLACAVALVPASPVDTSRINRPPILPLSLGGSGLAAVPLSEKELDYFTAYGGGAAKGRYGGQSLLLVTTTSPLRHLHAPDECLAGSGHTVERLGITYGRLPTAVYRSVDPSGRTWRVRVTYVDDRGLVATSVAEVVWRWLDRPGARWTAIERIGPWDAAASEDAAFDEAVARAFELPPPPSTETLAEIATKG